jgi:DNA-binding LytR/AlgR family response regulator
LAPADGLADLSAVEAHGSWAESAMQSARAVAFWMVANHAFDRYLGFPRFRYESEQRPATLHETATDERDGAEAGANGRAPELLARLTRFSSLDQVTAIKAEEHYVRVFGDGIEEMILYRFGRILVDVEKEDGFRVHRSHWVRRSAIAEKRTDGSRVTLILKDGAVIPVSRRYHELVEQVMKTLKRQTV